MVRRLGNLRLAVFAAAGVLLARWATTQVHASAWLGAAVIASIAFVALVRASTRAKRALQHTDDLIGLADAGMHRVARTWPQLPERDWPAEPSSHPYALDLDLFGPASLGQLMPPVSRAPGRAVLRQWLVAPSAPDVIRERQRAVAELRADTAFRESLQAEAARVTVSESALAELTTWAAAPGWLSDHRALGVLTWLVPIATIGLIVAQAVGLVGQAYWIAPTVIALILITQYNRQLTASVSPLAGRANTLRRYAEMTRLAVGPPRESPLLQSIRSRLSSPTPAADAMRRLTVLADSSELRLSPMMYFVVNTLTLWDFHVVRRLERWQRGSGRDAAGWMDALGEMEALAALATLAHDNPGWAFPDIDVSATAIEAVALGHPLLGDDVAVRNDVTVGPAGTLLLITGSNMAGKSTLLRSIGLNLVLSQAGSVVCATRLRHPPARLHTSMRVQDSLERGVSYFMAELQRLKSVVDAADAVRPGHGWTLVYLLDEILHGTNSAERTVAARQVLRHLVGAGAIGAVSTHDLQLVEDPELSAVAQQVHFSEQFSGADGATAMTFDYRLRPGKATSSNALKLLELVGLTRRD